MHGNQAKRINEQNITLSAVDKISMKKISVSWYIGERAVVYIFSFRISSKLSVPGAWEKFEPKSSAWEKLHKQAPRKPNKVVKWAKQEQSERPEKQYYKCIPHKKYII